MKAQELRIGNLVFIPKTNQITEISSIHSKLGIMVNDNIFGLLGFDEIKPIPPTEEWLLNLGFVECEGKYGTYFKCSKLDGFRVWHGEDEHTSWWSIGRKDYDNNETIVVYQNSISVNQLQNLYFSLTGEELIIKAVH